MPDNPATGFWDSADALTARHGIRIDRPKGSAHPRYLEVAYPLDYGYIIGTTAMDGGGIDVWVGSLGPGTGVTGAICTIDLTKGDSEVKFLIGCTDADMRVVECFHNNGNMRCLLMRR